MRKNEEYLAVLVNSDTAKLFTLPFFKKQKESTWVLVLKKVVYLQKTTINIFTSIMNNTITFLFIVFIVFLVIIITILLHYVKSYKSKISSLESDNKYYKQQIQEEFDIKRYKILRVYGYKYEDFIYSVFAEKRCLDPDGKSLTNGITKDVVINKIKNSEQFRGADPEKVIKLFEKYNLIMSIFRAVQKDGTSIPIYVLGPTLDKYANIISENDMNPYKWLENHIPK